MVSSSNVMAVCEDDLHSVGGSTTDGAIKYINESNNFSSGFAGSVQSLCDPDEDGGVPLPPITVYGYVSFANPAMLLGIYYSPSSGGSSGGGGSGDTVFQTNSSVGCSSAADERLTHAVATFHAAKAAAGVMGATAFIRKYKPGSTFTFPYPTGEIAKWKVSNPQFTHPFSHEVSCN